VTTPLSTTLNEDDIVMTTTHHETTGDICAYAPVNGLEMYYEIAGTGDPLVYIPPAHAHIGMKSFPALAQSHSVIMMDLQGHGRTADIPERPLSIERYAEDVVALLRHLGIARADFFGESYGGNAALMIALRHPELVGRVATYGASFGPPKIAHNPEMLRFDAPPTPYSRDLEFQRESYKTVAPDPEYWPKIWEKMGTVRWDGFSRDELASIEAPVLIVVGDRDFVRVEHALETSRLIPNAELAVIPDAGHFVLFSEPERVIPVVKHFLEKPAQRIPVATAGMGYHPGETR
jgi:pimeloyl-ACP methyl ester carboxylesterase